MLPAPPREGGSKREGEEKGGRSVLDFRSADVGDDERKEEQNRTLDSPFP